MNNMLEFNHVDKYYQGTRALHDINLSIEKGQMYFITGHSGAGKSTLLRLVIGLEKTSRGTIYVDGQDVSKLSGRQLALFRRQIGVIFQDPMLIDNYSVFENVALPLRIQGFGYKEIYRKVQTILDIVGLINKINKKVDTLSSGERQRVGIARALVMKPKILLADEPTGNLDPKLARTVMNLFERFSQVGITILIVTHNLELIKDFSHPIIKISNGRMIDANTEERSILEEMN